MTLSERCIGYGWIEWIDNRRSYGSSVEDIDLQLTGALSRGSNECLMVVDHEHRSRLEMDCVLKVETDLEESLEALVVSIDGINCDLGRADIIVESSLENLSIVDSCSRVRGVEEILGIIDWCRSKEVELLPMSGRHQRESGHTIHERHISSRSQRLHRNQRRNSLKLRPDSARLYESSAPTKSCERSLRECLSLRVEGKHTPGYGKHLLGDGTLDGGSRLDTGVITKELGGVLGSVEGRPDELHLAGIRVDALGLGVHIEMKERGSVVRIVLHPDVRELSRETILPLDAEGARKALGCTESELRHDYRLMRVTVGVMETRLRPGLEYANDVYKTGIVSVK
ncbi:hypothetical protein PMAYCL1PPCAC_21078 [Pristionchus mayeri]|uniref:Uncharacterized protein n=1 Tax=Pristionchus mayeri TaxID=1317129 RepID=A0AAN5CU24_9BILA|nr:hypothetical protein PMAYCL1PPCAC_21078 [Pristionchus mayeri]